MTTLTASDEDTASDQLVWTTPQDGMGGADADKFTLSSTGVLAFSAVKDYEDPDDADGDRTYEIIVQVSDGDNTVTADIRVTLQNVLELLTELTGPSSTDYAENGATRVATYIASSPEDNGDVTWSLSGADSGGFSIDGGALRFLSLPDFESPSDMGTDKMYSVTVAASDGHTKRHQGRDRDRHRPGRGGGADPVLDRSPAGKGADRRCDRPRRGNRDHPLDLGAFFRPDRVERHRRSCVAQLHAGGRRRGELPAGDGVLHRPPLRWQGGPGSAAQRRPGAYAEPA